MSTKQGEGFGHVNQRNHMTGPQAAVAGKLGVVSIALVKPNRHNYNVQSSETFNKLVENVREFGFVEPVIVRSLEGGQKEIINGEHRYHGALQLGMTEISIVDLGVVDDARAKQLTITLNELGGKPDQVRLAELLRDIHAAEGVSLEDLERLMPYSGKELDMLITAVDFSFANLSTDDTRRPVPEEPAAGDAPAGGANAAPEGGQGGALPVGAGGEPQEAVSFVYGAADAAKVRERLSAVSKSPEAALEKLLDCWDKRTKPKKKPGKKAAAGQDVVEPAAEVAQES